MSLTRPHIVPHTYSFHSHPRHHTPLLSQVIDFDGPVDLYHFYLLRAVGKGAFGKVRVVQHKQTKVRSVLQVAQSTCGLSLNACLSNIPLADTLCVEVYQQSKMHQNASSLEYHTRKETARRN